MEHDLPTLISKALDLVKGSLSYIAIFFSAILAEHVRRSFFGPKLKLSFGDGEEYRTLTPEGGEGGSAHQAYYVRVKVNNKSSYAAKNCRAFLVNVEKKDDSGKFKPTLFCDSLRLPWSCSEGEQYSPKDIPKGVNQFLDLVSTRGTIYTLVSGIDGPVAIHPSYKIEMHPRPYRYEVLFDDVGVHRYTVRVTADGAKSVTVRIIFKWEGDWEKFEVRKDNS